MYAGEMEFAIRLRKEKPLEMSWFGMPGWERPAWMKLHRKERILGKVVAEKIPVGNERTLAVEVYLPPGYDQTNEKKYPTIYVQDGSAARKLGNLDEVADLYFRSHPERASILVFLKNGQEGPPDAQTKEVAERVVPWIDGKYRTLKERQQRASYGAGFGCSPAMLLATSHGDLFGACAVQSPLVFDQARAAAIDGFLQLKKPTRLYLEWGRFDMHNPVENWDIREMAREMRQSVSRNPNVSLSGGRVSDSTDWGSWINRFDRIVESLLGS